MSNPETTDHNEREWGKITGMTDEEMHAEGKTPMTATLTICHAASDGECTHPRCPQILDGYCDSNGNPIGLPSRPHRDCPLPWRSDDD